MAEAIQMDSRSMGQDHGHRMTWLQYLDRWAVVALAIVAVGLAAVVYGCAG